MYRVIDIIRGTTVDGPGFRTAIYLAGCRHRCEGCHNPQSWDWENGIPYSLQEIMDIVREEDFDVTLTGGDPLYHPASLTLLVKALKDNARNVWIYTGYTWEEINRDEALYNAIAMADVLVDGPFIKELRDPDLKFRGSANQRIINIPQSIKNNRIVLYQ